MWYSLIKLSRDVQQSIIMTNELMCMSLIVLQSDIFQFTSQFEILCDCPRLLWFLQ